MVEVSIDVRRRPAVRRAAWLSRIADAAVQRPKRPMMIAEHLTRCSRARSRPEQGFRAARTAPARPRRGGRRAAVVSRASRRSSPSTIGIGALRVALTRVWPTRCCTSGVERHGWRSDPRVLVLARWPGAPASGAARAGRRSPARCRRRRWSRRDRRSAVRPARRRARPARSARDFAGASAERRGSASCLASSIGRGAGDARPGAARPSRTDARLAGGPCAAAAAERARRDHGPAADR